MELVKFRGKYAVYWREGNNPIRRSLGTSDPTEAKRRFSEFKRALDVRRSEGGYTLKDLWEARKKALGSRRLADNMEWSGKALMPIFGSLGPMGITQDFINQYARDRKKAPGTVWTELNHLRMTLNWAKKQGMINDIPFFTLPSTPPPKADYLTKDQARAFIQSLEFPHLRLFTLLALSTGARRGAILELKWEQVDLDKQTIDFNPPGHDQIRRKGRGLVPINDTLLPALTEAKDFARTDYVVEYSGERVASVTKGIKSAAKRSGLPFVSPHVFRHSAAVWMAESGIDIEEIAQFLGHTNPSITRKVYARFSPTYLRKAAGVLEL
jgi:integrase